jgi:hypothetical protein
VSKDKPRNLAASVRHRLMDLARKQGEDFQLVLTRYVIERVLYRLSRSPYRDEFVLKGAMLFRVWTNHIHRPTRDLDLLGRGKPTQQALADIFRDICGLAVEDDGLTFDPATVTAERIKEDQEYEGVRVGCRAQLGQARNDLQIDVCPAIRATFNRRKTALPSAPPLALTEEFGADVIKVRQWEAFIRKGKLDAAGITLEQVCAFLNGFLMPPTLALHAGQKFQKAWPPAGPWSDSEASRFT